MTHLRLTATPHLWMLSSAMLVRVRVATGRHIIHLCADMGKTGFLGHVGKSLVVRFLGLGANSQKPQGRPKECQMYL